MKDKLPTRGSAHAAAGFAPTLHRAGRGAGRRLLVGLALIACLTFFGGPAERISVLGPATAAAQATKSYDTKLLRISEILGAVHYLRELCGSEDGQLWREQMQRLIKAEGFTALRKARLARSFNKGYQSYSRTYKICTSTARTAIERFLDEGTEIAEGLIRSNP